MIFQNSCSKDHILFKKKNGNLLFSKKKKKEKKKKEKSHFKKKKKSFFFKNLVLLNYILTWSSMKEVRRQPFKSSIPITQITLENKVKKSDKLVWVHVRLSSFVLHQACLNLGHWPIYIVCEYVLLIWKHVFIWGINPFFAIMSTLGALAKNVLLIIGF